MAFSRFFKMAAAAALDFGNFKFLTVGTVETNFVKIGQTAKEIWLFFEFSRWRPPPSWIFKISNFSGLNGHRSNCVFKPNFVKIA